jgi:hypothetical protein
MAVANHEGSKIQFTGVNENGTPHAPEIGRDIHEIAYQSANVTVRTNNEPISAIGFRGVAAVSDLIGTVELALDGILTVDPSDFSPYLNRGPLGLLNTNLNSIVSKFGDIIVDTLGEDIDDVGLKCSMSGMFATGISFSFQQNASVTTTWNFVGYNCEWEDSDFDFGIDLVVGTGVNFIPISSKDVQLSVIAPEGDAAGVQSVTFNATINRTEVFELGTLEPVDRPVTFPFEVTATIEALADTASLVRGITPNYKWNNPATPSSPNVYQINVDYITSGPQRLVGAPYMRPTDSTMAVSVGNNSTVTMTFTGWDLEF